MFEGSPSGLRSRIDAMAYRSTLHEDDRVMTILTRDGSGKSKHVARLRAPSDQLEARCREMVALVDDQMTVFPDNIGDDAFAHQTLDDRDIDAALGFPSTSGDRAELAHVDG